MTKEQISEIIDRWTPDTGLPLPDLPEPVEFGNFVWFDALPEDIKDYYPAQIWNAMEKRYKLYTHRLNVDYIG